MPAHHSHIMCLTQNQQSIACRWIGSGHHSFFFSLHFLILFLLTVFHIVSTISCFHVDVYSHSLDISLSLNANCQSSWIQSMTTLNTLLIIHRQWTLSTGNGRNSWTLTKHPHKRSWNRNGQRNSYASQIAKIEWKNGRAHFGLAKTINFYFSPIKSNWYRSV